jgi:hypothetical protein
MSDIVVIDEKRERLNNALQNLESTLSANAGGDGKKLSDYTELVKDKAVSMIKNGTAPWLLPHTGTEDIPFNPVTGYTYNGFDLIWLKMAQNDLGSKDPRWLSFYEIQNEQLLIKKYEKATKLLYFKAQDDGVKKLKIINLFNGSQIEDMPAYERPVRDSPLTRLYYPTSLHPRNTLKADLVNYIASLKEQKSFDPKGATRAGIVAEYLESAGNGVFYFVSREAGAEYKKRALGREKASEAERFPVSEKSRGSEQAF